MNTDPDFPVDLFQSIGDASASIAAQFSHEPEAGLIDAAWARMEEALSVMQSTAQNLVEPNADTDLDLDAGADLDTGGDGVLNACMPALRLMAGEAITPWDDETIVAKRFDFDVDSFERFLRQRVSDERVLSCWKLSLLLSQAERLMSRFARKSIICSAFSFATRQEIGDNLRDCLMKCEIVLRDAGQAELWESPQDREFLQTFTNMASLALAKQTMPSDNLDAAIDDLRTACTTLVNEKQKTSAHLTAILELTQPMLARRR